MAGKGAITAGSRPSAYGMRGSDQRAFGGLKKVETEVCAAAGLERAMLCRAQKPLERLATQQKVNEETAKQKAGEEEAVGRKRPKQEAAAARAEAERAATGSNNRREDIEGLIGEISCLGTSRCVLQRCWMLRAAIDAP